MALLTFSWDKQASCCANALDFGSTFKRGANAQDNDNANAKNDGDAPAVEQQRIVDASTGTITSNDYDYAASTTKGAGNSNPNCNELMAQAVVLASEEKELALSDRDTAQAELLACQKELEIAEAGMKEEKEDSLKLKVELEAVRLMTDRLIEEANDEHREKNESLIKDHDDAISEWEKRMDELEEKRLNGIIDLRETHEIEVARLQFKAEADLVNVQEEMGDLQAKMHSFEIRSKEEMYILKKSHNQTVAELEADHLVQISLLKKEQAKLLNAHEEELQSIRLNHEKTVSAMENQFEKYMAESKNSHKAQITKLTEQSQADMDEVMTKVTEKMNEIELEMAHVKKTAADDLISAEKRAQEENAALKSDFQAIREKLTMKLQTLELAIQDSESVLANTKEELKYWKNVGMVATSTHFNSTLIKSDVSAYVKHANTEIREWISTHSTFLYNEVESTGTKYMNMLWVRIKPLYETHMSEVVDRTLIPAYKKHVTPVQIKYVRPAVVKVMEVTVETRGQVTKIAMEKRLQGIAIIESFLNEVTVQRFVVTKIPLWAQGALKDMAADASVVFDCLSHVLGIYIVWKLKSRLLRCLVWITLLPFRMVWFFCPLRLFFGRTKNSKVVDFPANGLSNGHLNGNHPVKAEKAEDANE